MLSTMHFRIKTSISALSSRVYKQPNESLTTVQISFLIQFMIHYFTPGDGDDQAQSDFPCAIFLSVVGQSVACLTFTCTTFLYLSLYLFLFLFFFVSLSLSLSLIISLYNTHTVCFMSLCLCLFQPSSVLIGSSYDSLYLRIKSICGLFRFDVHDARQRTPTTLNPYI